MRKVAFAKPWLGQEEASAAAEAVLSGWVTQGPRVKRFEDDFAALTGAARACAVSNCTVALQMALAECGVGPGDVVLTVSHSFIATANAVRAVGAEPVFVDIDPDTLNMDPKALARVIEREFEATEQGLRYVDATRLAVPGSLFERLREPYGRLGAVLAVHQLGMPADLAGLLAVAGRHGVPLIEDAACACGSALSLDGGATWEPVGKPHGRTACFSFHPRKIVTTGDGGMLTYTDAGADAQFRLLRQHGMSLSDAARHGAGKVVFEDYLVAGFNYRMTDIQAAVGVEQLKRLPEMVSRRRDLARLYGQALAALPGVSLQREPEWARTNWQSYFIRIEDAALQVPVMQELLDKGVGTRRGVMCAHLEPPYAGVWEKGCLPASEQARDAGIILPLHHEMTPDDVAYVAECLEKALRR